MKIRNTGGDGEKIELQMTPMIDIVFQLLVFFIMTFKIVAAIHWEAFRLWLKGMRVVDHKPAAQAVASSVAQPPFTRT